MYYTSGFVREMDRDKAFLYSVNQQYIYGKPSKLDSKDIDWKAFLLRHIAFIPIGCTISNVRDAIALEATKHRIIISVVAVFLNTSRSNKYYASICTDSWEQFALLTKHVKVITVLGKSAFVKESLSTTHADGSVKTIKLVVKGLPYPPSTGGLKGIITSKKIGIDPHSILNATLDMNNNGKPFSSVNLWVQGIEVAENSQNYVCHEEKTH